jgi:hypothetical protein
MHLGDVHTRHVPGGPHRRSAGEPTASAKGPHTHAGRLVARSHSHLLSGDCVRLRGRCCSRSARHIPAISRGYGSRTDSDSRSATCLAHSCDATSRAAAGSDDGADHQVASLHPLFHRDGRRDRHCVSRYRCRQRRLARHHSPRARILAPTCGLNRAAEKRFRAPRWSLPSADGGRRNLGFMEGGRVACR